MNIVRFLFFIAPQLAIIFFYIHTRSTVTKLSYLKQKNEKKYKQLCEENLKLNQKIQKRISPTTLQESALEQGMTPLRLNNIKLLE